jgi:excisionase family DNA binding protein
VTRQAADILADLAALAGRQAQLTAELADALRAPALAPACPANDVPEYLTTAEAAKVLGVSECHLKALRAEGRGPAFLRLGKAVRYPRASLALENTVQLPSSARRPVPSSAAKSR